MPEEPEKLESIAGRLKEELARQPRATVPELAEALGTAPGVVEVVLDEYSPADDGSIEHVGQGKGGPWAEAA